MVELDKPFGAGINIFQKKFWCYSKLIFVDIEVLAINDFGSRNSLDVPLIIQRDLMLNLVKEKFQSPGVLWVY